MSIKQSALIHTEHFQPLPYCFFVFLLYAVVYTYIYNSQKKTHRRTNVFSRIYCTQTTPLHCWYESARTSILYCRMAAGGDDYEQLPFMLHQTPVLKARPKSSKIYCRFIYRMNTHLVCGRTPKWSHQSECDIYYTHTYSIIVGHWSKMAGDGELNASRTYGTLWNGTHECLHLILDWHGSGVKWSWIKIVLSYLVESCELNKEKQ